MPFKMDFVIVLIIKPHLLFMCFFFISEFKLTVIMYCGNSNCTSVSLANLKGMLDILYVQYDAGI